VLYFGEVAKDYSGRNAFTGPAVCGKKRKERMTGKFNSYLNPK
jgi:hypothetical protein